MVNRSTAPLVFMLDDDMLWTASIDIQMMISILQDADIVTGGLSDRDAFTGSIRLYDANLLLCDRCPKNRA